MNNTSFGFQLLDLSELTGFGRTFKAGVFDSVKKAVDGHKKNFIVKGLNGKHYVISNADVLYITEAQQYRITLPIDGSGYRQIVFVESTDYYRVVNVPVVESIRPTSYGITVDVGTLNFNDGVVQTVSIVGISNVINGVDFDSHARVGDTVNLVVKGIINDDTTTSKDFLVVIPCAVLAKSQVADKVGTEFKDCVVAPSGREVLIEAVDDETNRVSYIVTPGSDFDRTMRVGQNTLIEFSFQKMV